MRQEQSSGCTYPGLGIPQEGFANPHGTEALVLVVAMIVPKTLTQKPKNTHSEPHTLRASSAPHI